MNGDGPRLASREERGSYAAALSKRCRVAPPIWRLVITAGCIKPPTPGGFCIAFCSPHGGDEQMFGAK